MDVHFNAYKCKYEALTNWIKPYTRSMNINSIRIFINLDDFFHTLFRPLTNDEFEVCGSDASKQFLSNIFNLIAHYRFWAIKQGYDVEVYSYYTKSKSFKNQIYRSNYRQKSSDYIFGNKYFYISETIKQSLDMIHLVASYIPNVYVVNTEFIEPSAFPAYIEKSKGPKDLNVLVSRDIYDLQYAYRDRWIYISPKGDNSSFIHKGNMWDYINYKEHIYSDKRELHYSPKLLILARALVGDKYRDIPRLRSIGWKTLFKFIDQVSTEIEGENYVVLEMSLRELLKGKLVLDSELQANINCIDIDQQVSTMTKIDSAILDNQIIDIEDFENLKMLNKIQLSRYPLNLKFLCDKSHSTKIDSQWYLPR